MKDLIVFLAPGFEEIEALTVVDFLRRAGAKVTVAAIGEDLIISSSHGVKLQADDFLARLDPNDYRAAYIPGGLPGATNLAADHNVLAWVRQFHAEQKLLAAICAGPIVFDSLGLLKQGQFTCYPGFEKNLETEGRIEASVVKDGQLWTAMGPVFAQFLALELVEELCGKEARSELEKGLLYPELKALIKNKA
ncbi:MAG: DJ-1/PfpI family protein [Eubacteriales bacterium]|nr:DJ-1/PfpI family protein [Eubacteriales bacterium]